MKPNKTAWLLPLGVALPVIALIAAVVALWGPKLAELVLVALKLVVIA